MANGQETPKGILKTPLAVSKRFGLAITALSPINVLDNVDTALGGSIVNSTQK